MGSATLFVFGLVLGSFLNVCIDRIPRGQSIVLPPSHCDICGHRLVARDLIPIVSYLMLKGRCRYCAAPITWRLPVVELANGLLFAGLGSLLGWGIRLLPALAYGSLFLVILAIDLETQKIPNRLILPAIPAVWLLSALWPSPAASSGVLDILGISISAGGVALPLLLSLAGGAVAFTVMLIPWLLYPGGMGAGDLKLAAVVGLATGFPLSLLALFISFLGGGIIGGALLLSGIKGRKDAIPFGPFLTVAGMVALLWGDVLVRWYWQSFSL